MRIETLDLRAFGPFSGKLLDLRQDQDGRSGLVCIFGPNEAGKSSGLRALKAWLFGFPERTTDGFLHGMSQLLVGGLIRLDDGQELEFFRRKKRVADLVDRSGQPLADPTLTRFLDGLDARLFDSLYGIDHQALVQGGRDLLHDRGELGGILFAAGTGSRSLHALLAGLRSRAESLYKPRGSKPPINAAIRRHRELQQEIRVRSLSPERYREQQQRAEGIAGQLHGIEEERCQTERQIQFLRRIGQAIPLLARRSLFRERLRDLGNLPGLPAGFFARRRAVAEKLERGRLELRKLDERDKVLSGRLAALQLRPLFVDQARLIEEVHRGLGGYGKALQDRPGLELMRRNTLSRAVAMLATLAPGGVKLADWSEEYSVFLGRSRRIQEMAGRHAQLRGQLLQLGESLEAAVREQRDLNTQLAELPKPAGEERLFEAIRQARGHAPLDEAIQARKQAIAAEEVAVTKALRRLGLWHGDPAAIVETAMVAQVTVSHFQERFRQLEDKRLQLQPQIAAVEAELRTIQEDLALLRIPGGAARMEELGASRKDRDQHWHWVQQRWLAGKSGAGDTRVSDQALARNCTERMLASDFLADQLYQEADRIRQHEQLRAREKRLREELAVLAGTQMDMEQLESILNQEWRELWQTLAMTPRSPGEMQDWLGRWQELRERASRLEEQKKELVRWREQRRALVQLLAGLVDHQETLELTPLLLAGEAMLERWRQLQSQRQALEKEITESKRRLSGLQARQASCQEELAQWQKSWNSLARLSGTNQPVSPEESTELIAHLQHISELMREVDGFGKRLDGIDRDCREFRQRVQTLASHLHGEQGGVVVQEEVEQTVMSLRDQLGSALRDEALHRELAGERSEIEGRIAALHLEIAALSQQEAALLAQAGCATPDLVDQLEYQVTEQERAREKLAELEDDLVRLWGNRDLARLEHEAAEINPDELPGRLADLERRLEEELGPALRDLSEELGRERNVLESMDGGCAAAGLAEELQHNLVTLRDAAGEFVTLRLAMALLSRQIEQYRQANQGPVLQRTASFYARMTLGAFAGVAADFDEQGNPVLVALRPDGRRLGVEALSTGSRDQLYLALRLATMEQRRGTGESMPLIMDDILINFDAQRSLAALEILAALGEQGQVLLFTHNSQVAAQVEAMGTKARLLHLA